MKKLNQYRGRLTAAQIAEGMTAACANAHRLAEAAKLLLEKGLYGPAATMAAIAIEEAGKPPILRSIALARSEQELVQSWRDYRTHTKKNPMWLLPQLAAQGATKLDDFKELYLEDAEHTFLLDKIKQIGIYTDCLGKAHWSIPSEVVDKKLAASLVAIAHILGREKSFSELEIELWIKHLKPVWKRPKELMEHGLVLWYQDMQRHGLAPNGQNEMEDFILSGHKGKSGGT